MSIYQQPGPHRILLVDDNPSIHEDFRKILCPNQTATDVALTGIATELFDEPQATSKNAARLNFEVDSAYQGHEALERVKAADAEGRPYALAFVDVRMPPGWDGVETIERIWKEHPALQVVICTAYSDYSWEQILHKLGESDSLLILKKPFDNVEVLQLAQALTRKWVLTRRANAQMADLDRIVRVRTQELQDASRELQAEIQRRALIEAALRESEVKFRQAFQGAPVALAVRHLDTGRFLEVNSCFLTLTGYDREEVLDLVPEELLRLDAAANGQDLPALLRGGCQVWNCPVKIRRKDGEIRAAAMSAELLPQDGAPWFVTALLDVTDQKGPETRLCLAFA